MSSTLLLQALKNVFLGMLLSSIPPQASSAFLAPSPLSASVSSFQRLVATPFLYAWTVSWTAAMAVGILPNSLGDWYKSHNYDIGNAAEVQRVYIYSSTDVITEYKDIEAHVAESKAKGFSVTLEKFKDSAHVLHSRKDKSIRVLNISKVAKDI